jgi:hypothetical protein
MKRYTLVRNAIIFWRIPELRWSLIKAYGIHILQAPFFVIAVAILSVGLALLWAGHLIRELADWIADHTFKHLDDKIQDIVTNSRDIVSDEEVVRRANLPKRNHP